MFVVLLFLFLFRFQISANLIVHVSIGLWNRLHYSVLIWVCICFVVLLSIGDIGGADRTFACKSQECLWQDWYIWFWDYLCKKKENVFNSLWPLNKIFCPLETLSLWHAVLNTLLRSKERRATSFLLLSNSLTNWNQVPFQSVGNMVLFPVNTHQNHV